MLPDLSKECVFTTSRSSGPGGQNVNKTETKVELRINIAHSSILSEDQKARILELYGDKLIEQRTTIMLTCQESRSQITNKKWALQKLYLLLENLLEIETPRLATKIPHAVKQKRLSDKRRASQTKASRNKPRNEGLDED